MRIHIATPDPYVSVDSSCTAFKAVGHEAARGPSCLLLTNTTAALPAALSVPPGADWPHELVDLSANGSMQLRSVGWLCLKGADLWDTLGQATHAAIHAGSAGKLGSSNKPAGSSRCR